MHVSTLLELPLLRMRVEEANVSILSAIESEASILKSETNLVARPRMEVPTASEGHRIRIVRDV